MNTVTCQTIIVISAMAFAYLFVQSGHHSFGVACLVVGVLTLAAGSK